MLSKYGRQFNVNPKGWRLFIDFLENDVVAGRSAAALIQLWQIEIVNYGQIGIAIYKIPLILACNLDLIELHVFSFCFYEDVWNLGAMPMFNIFRF
ncbi:hypothetical protein ACS0TY_027430 [Phlomoides rotata]